MRHEDQGLTERADGARYMQARVGVTHPGPDDRVTFRAQAPTLPEIKDGAVLAVGPLHVPAPTQTQLARASAAVAALKKNPLDAAAYGALGKVVEESSGSRFDGSISPETWLRLDSFHTKARWFRESAEELAKLGVG